MARVAMVTRTMETTKATVLCLDLITQLATTKEVILAGTFKDAKSLMKATSAKVDNDKEKAVHVTKSEKVETLYGMTEDDFIKNAEILPARKTTEAPAVNPEVALSEAPAVNPEVALSEALKSEAQAVSKK